MPTHDWEALAEAALESLNLEIARNAYIRIRNLEKLQLINDLEVNINIGYTIVSLEPEQIPDQIISVCQATLASIRF